MAALNKGIEALTQALLDHESRAVDEFEADSAHFRPGHILISEHMPCYLAAFPDKVLR